MSIGDIIKDTLLVIGGGGLAAIFNFISNKRKADSNDFQIISTAYRDEFDRLQKRIEAFELREIEAEKRYNILLHKYTELEEYIRKLASDNPRLKIPKFEPDEEDI